MRERTGSGEDEPSDEAFGIHLVVKRHVRGVLAAETCLQSDGVSAGHELAGRREDRDVVAQQVRFVEELCRQSSQ